MDANNLLTNIIKEGLSKGMYEITGVLPTGEITIAILCDVEKECLDELFSKDILDSEKLKYVNRLRTAMGRPAEELLYVYKQRTCDKNLKCLKNGLLKR